MYSYARCPRYASFDIEKTRSLHSVYLSGAFIHPLLVEICKTTFGAKYAIPTFGMTEGVDAFSWPVGCETKMNDSHCGLGKFMPGAKIRICPTGSRDPVKSDELGELHASSPWMIRG